MNDLPFTVFTPTYNRSHTLKRLYDSLCLQRADLFEWLVVDDGSSDDTPALLSRLARLAAFPIRVISQPNGGKHRAHNTAITEAHGELTIVLDSDDALIPGALAVLWAEWEMVRRDSGLRIVGLLGHAVFKNGEIVGARYPAHRVDGHLFELAASGVIVGDKLPCYKTDVLKEFPFPERAGCTEVVPEGVVWIPIGEKYRVRCLDVIVLVCYSDTGDPISLMNSYRRLGANAWGRIQNSVTILNVAGHYLPRYTWRFIKATINCTRFSIHGGCGILYPAGLLAGNLQRVLWLVGVLPGLLTWIGDLIISRTRQL